MWFLIRINELLFEKNYAFQVFLFTEIISCFTYILVKFWFVSEVTVKA